MITLLAAFCALAQTQNPPIQRQVGQDPPRLKFEFANGSRLLVEPNSTSKSIIVQLFASSRLVDDSKFQGARHLLEHLSALGKDGKLDQRLELEGAFLSAETLRDATQIRVDLPPGQLALGLDALREILATKGWTAEDLKRESKIIHQEIALRDDASKLGSSAWWAAYGSSGVDPIGTDGSLAKVSPADLESVRKSVYNPSNITVVIEGPITIKEAERAGTAFLESLPTVKAVTTSVERIPLPKPETAAPVDGNGEARAIAVGSLGDDRTLAVLASAFGIASDIPGSFVTYTPSLAGGLVVVGNTASDGRFSSWFSDRSDSDAQSLYPRGRQLAFSWILRLTASPEASSFNRGILLDQSSIFKIENVLDHSRQLSENAFDTAMAQWRSPDAIKVKGGPR